MSIIKLNREKNVLQETMRNNAAANIFKIINSPEESEKALKKFRSMSDENIKLMAEFLKIPADQLETYKALTKGEPNDFTNDLNNFSENNFVKSGDIILMQGIATSSKILVKLQKTCYLNVKSSHVAIVQSEFVAVDTIPKEGVSLRLISEILNEVEDDWRIIRFTELNENYTDLFLTGCAFYLTQPYLIKPARGSMKKFSYCSELARKIYNGLNLKNTGIPKSAIIKPCDFDRLADTNDKWVDVTNDVRDFINFTKKYEAIIKSISKLQIDGVKLNQSRFKERREILQALPKLIEKGQITAEKAQKIKKEIKELEKKMNFQFWNYQ